MAFPLTLKQLDITKYAAETMVYIERHKLLEIITQILAEIAIARPQNPREWIFQNIVRIADGIYRNCIQISNDKTVACKFYQLPRRFHHRVVVYGRRGSGRKSQGLSLAKQFNLVYIDVNNLIQHNLSANSDVAKQLQKAFLKDDVRVKSKAVCKVLSDRFLQTDCLQKGWIVVNFPNNLCECKELFEKFTVPPNKFVILDCPEDIAMQRTLSLPELGCPQDLSSHIQHEMAAFNKREREMTEYLRNRFEVLTIDSRPPFECVRMEVLGKLETTPYLMGFKEP